uniref:Uncharacterized protein n=1 Tax=Romanomermis culicivorax TaxID=13658 RepID=A0A915J167_ROMCU
MSLAKESRKAKNKVKQDHKEATKAWKNTSSRRRISPIFPIDYQNGVITLEADEKPENRKQGHGKATSQAGHLESLGETPTMFGDGVHYFVHEKREKFDKNNCNKVLSISQKRSGLVSSERKLAQKTQSGFQDYKKNNLQEEKEESFRGQLS